MVQFIFVLAGSMSVITFGLGYLLGTVLAEKRLKSAIDRFSQVRNCMLTQLHRHFGVAHVANQMLRNHLPVAETLDSDVFATIEQLVRANRELFSHLNSVKWEMKTIYSDKRHSPQPIAADQHLSAQSDDMHLVASATSRAESFGSDGDGEQEDSNSTTVIPDDVLHLLPHAVNVRQSIAVYDLGIIPSAEDFESVHCVEITDNGFSFVYPKPPRFQTLIVELKQSIEPVYKSAHVARISTRGHDGQMDFQVHCEFTGRMHRSLFDT